MSNSITLAAKKSNEDSTKPLLPNVQIFKRVGLYLLLLLGAEVNHGSNLLFASQKSQKGQCRLKEEFQSQFENYARSQWPFNSTLQQSQSPLNWWQNLVKNDQASIVAVNFCVIKIQYILIVCRL